MPYKREADRKRYLHDWYVKNRARIIARSTAYNKKHRTRRLRRYRTLYAARYRKTKLMRMYGLTSRQFDRLDPIERCQLCGRKRPLTYDHNHKNGRIRGRICNSCNLGLGQIGDTVAAVRRALRYLRRSK